MKPFFEKIPTSPESSFTCYLRKAKEFPFEWHYHPEYELTAILESEGRRLVGDSVEDFAPGDLVLVGPDLPHTWHSTSCPRTSDCEAVVIQFSGQFLGDRFFNATEMRPAREMLDRSARGIGFDEKTWAVTGEKIINLVEIRGFDRLMALLSILDELARCSDARPLSASSVRSNVRDQSRVNEVFRFMSENLDRPIRQSEAAALVGMSPSSFSRFFRRVSRASFSTRLSEMRIARACAQLIESDMDIIEICFASGFRNLSNFNRRFRKLKGCSPRQYRREFRK